MDLGIVEFFFFFNAQLRTAIAKTREAIAFQRELAANLREPLQHCDHGWGEMLTVPSGWALLRKRLLPSKGAGLNCRFADWLLMASGWWGRGIHRAIATI